MIRCLSSAAFVLGAAFIVGCGDKPPVPPPIADAAGEPAPTSVPQLDAAVYVRAFDQLWSEMDRNYSYFELRKIDWVALKSKYRPRAEAAKSPGEFVGAIRPMLAELKDQHIVIDGPDGRVCPHPQPYDQNWSFPGMRAHVADGGMVGTFVSVGRLKMGYGLLVVEDQLAATPELAALAAEKIEALGSAPGFVVDLRMALGGNEGHSMPLASAFCAAPTVYATQKFRNGPKHSDFGPVESRTLTAGKRPFTKPVVVLLGSATVSSGEGLAMMFAALPNVTTLGSRTRGSSGFPLPLVLKEVGVTVTYSRWVAMLPDGTPIEGRGVIPQIEARFPITEFGARDPVFERALEVLKEKVK